MKAESFTLDSNLPYELVFVSVRMPGTDSPDFAAARILADVASSQRADLYGFVDERGVAHFSNYPVDSRYYLFRKDRGSTSNPHSNLVITNVPQAPRRKPMRIDPATREITVFAHNDRMNQPNDLAIAPDGTLYASDPNWEQLPPVVREQRILRQTALKCAVHMLPYLEASMQNVSGLEFVAERFVAYFMGGPQDAAVQQALANTAQAQRNEFMGQTPDETPPDWVQQDGPVAADYNAGQAAQPTAPYTGGFPS